MKYKVLLSNRLVVCLPARQLIHTVFTSCKINICCFQSAVINNAMWSKQEILIDGWQRLILLGLISEVHKTSANESDEELAIFSVFNSMIFH